ncbi:sigma factor [Streptomyces flaveolus]
MLGNRPDTEDAVQEAPLIAFRHIADVRQPGSAGAWLRLILRNVCPSRLRAPGPGRGRSGDGPREGRPPAHSRAWHRWCLRTRQAVSPGRRKRVRRDGGH